MEFVGKGKKALAKNDIVRVLRISPFAFMMTSEFFSQLAFNMQHFVLIFIIYGITHSNTAVSGIILSFTVPAVLFSLITGVYVDRWSKKKVLFFTNLLRGFFLLPFLIPHIGVGFIYALTFLIAVATQFFLPAESAIIPSLVPKNLILSANAIFSLGIYGTTLAGYVLAGPVLLLLGEAHAFILLSLLFFISTFFIMLINIPSKKREEDKVKISSLGFSITKETREIFSFIRKARRVAYALSMLTISQAVLFMFAVLTPGYVTTILHVQIESLSWILIAPAAVGMVMGALILGSVGKKFKRRWLSTAGFMLSGIMFILFPFGNKVTSHGFVKVINSYLPHFFDITIFHIVILMAFVVGFAISLVFIPSNATIQIETNEEMRGRIYGFLNALIGAVSFLPVLLAGGLADLLGVGTVITSFGIGMLIISAFFFVVD